jgi:hypothetical protein
LQDAFRHPKTHGQRLQLNKHVHSFLQDFRWLARDLSQQMTHIHEIIPYHPSTLGTCDAAGMRMGGVRFLPTNDSAPQPILWRAPFPTAVVWQLVTSSNPAGTITNSDLELTGTIAQHDVLAHEVNIREHTIHNSHANTAVVYWQRIGSTSTTGPTAYLLHIQALHQRFHRYLPLHDYIPGPVNAMVDDGSRLWNLHESQLIQHFNPTYPQTKSWRFCPLWPPLLSTLISLLFRTRSEPPSYLAMPKQPTTIGSGGLPSASASGSTTSFPRPATLSRSSKSSPPIPRWPHCPPR